MSAKVVVGLLRPYAGPIAQSVAIGALVSVLSLVSPYVTMRLVDGAYAQRSVGLVGVLLVSGALVAATAGVAAAANGHLAQCLDIAVGLDLQERLYRHLQGLDTAFFERHQTGELMARFDDLRASATGLVAVIASFLTNSLQLVVFPAVLLHLHWRLALLALAVLPFDAALAAVSRWRYAHLGGAMAEAAAALSARVCESLAGVRVIQSVGAEATFMRQLGARLLGVAELRHRMSRLQHGAGLLATLLRVAGGLAYSWYGWHEVLAGRLSLGALLAFSAYVLCLYGPIQALMLLLPQVEVLATHMRRFVEVYQTQPLVRDCAGARVLSRTAGRLEFREVSYSYGRGPVLDQASLVIEPGTCVAVVGASGAGKSTLARMVPRFLDPDTGAVYLDGHDLRECQLRSLRSQIGFAMQGHGLFSGTVRDNLTLGQPVGQRDLDTAVRAAAIDDLVDALPRGYDTPLGEAGVSLSEGQKQRLSLARVFLLDRPILVLDEPTASLDADSEAAVVRAFQQVRRGRTCLVVAHRSAMVAQADRVVGLRHGRIVELDPHAAARVAAACIQAPSAGGRGRAPANRVSR